VQNAQESMQVWEAISAEQSVQKKRLIKSVDGQATTSWKNKQQLQQQRMI